MSEVKGTEFSFEADLVLLAMGFVHPIHEGLINSLGVNLTPTGNLDANDKEYKHLLINCLRWRFKTRSIISCLGNKRR